jgi:hypothetical protein
MIVVEGNAFEGKTTTRGGGSETGGGGGTGFPRPGMLIAETWRRQSMTSRNGS